MYCRTVIGVLWLGDDYDFDRPSRPGRHPNQLEDIREWNSGNKSIAEEAIDKFKEIVGRVKFFDTADYPYVAVPVYHSSHLLYIMLSVMPSSHCRQDKTVLSCRRRQCELNWRQVKTVVKTVQSPVD